MTKQIELPVLDREALTDLIAEHLSGTYHCHRVWNAWNVGTMSEGDFSEVNESDTPAEIADAILAAIAKHEEDRVVGEPVAWMHTMDSTDGIEGNEPRKALTFSEENPFGVPGRDYSETYPVTSTPLFAAPVAQPATEANTVEFVHDPKCRLCAGRGYYVARYSGRADDGNAPEHEECDCWIPATEAEQAEAPSTAPALMEGPYLMATAPKDSTIVRLLVEFEDGPFEEDNLPQWTIGTNHLNNTGVDEWLFAGWDWTHDRFTQGSGKVIGWLPMLATQPTASPEQAEAPSDWDSNPDGIKPGQDSPVRMDAGTGAFDAPEVFANVDRARAALQRPTRGWSLNPLLQAVGRAQAALNGHCPSCKIPLSYEAGHSSSYGDPGQLPTLFCEQCGVEKVQTAACATQPTASNAGEREAVLLKDGKPLDLMASLEWAITATERTGSGRLNAVLVAARAALASKPPQGEQKAVERVELYGVKDGKETFLGTAPMPPRMKARELAREMFGPFQDDDASDAEMCFAAMGQLIEHMQASAQPEQVAQDELTPEDVDLLEQVVNDFCDDGETMVDHSDLMRFVNMGYLECEHFMVAPSAQKAIDAARARGEGGRND